MPQLSEVKAVKEFQEPKSARRELVKSPAGWINSVRMFIVAQNTVSCEVTSIEARLTNLINIAVHVRLERTAAGDADHPGGRKRDVEDAAGRGGEEQDAPLGLGGVFPLCTVDCHGGFIDRSAGGT